MNMGPGGNWEHGHKVKNLISSERTYPRETCINNMGAVYSMS